MFSNGDRLIGLVVDQILDIVEEHVTVRKSSETFGLMGSAVVGQRSPILWICMRSLRIPAKNGPDPKRHMLAGSTVMVVEKSPFARAHLRSSLEMAGY